jgi:hypothetical protein
LSANVRRNTTNVLLHHIASWQFERNGGSTLFSLHHGFLQVPFRAMHRTDRNVGLSGDGAHAHAGRQQWRNLGPSGIVIAASRGRCEVGHVDAHEQL